jgi:hypothetical protein
MQVKCVVILTLQVNCNILDWGWGNICSLDRCLSFRWKTMNFVCRQPSIRVVASKTLTTVTTDTRHIDIFVKTLTSETLPIHIGLSSTVVDLKNRIRDIEGAPPNEQRLVYYGRYLDGRRTLQCYNIQKESTLHLVLSLAGGSTYSPFRPSHHLFNTLACRLCRA